MKTQPTMNEKQLRAIRAKLYRKSFKIVGGLSLSKGDKYGLS